MAHHDRHVPKKIDYNVILNEKNYCEIFKGSCSGSMIFSLVCIPLCSKNIYVCKIAEFFFRRGGNKLSGYLIIVHCVISTSTFYLCLLDHSIIHSMHFYILLLLL